MQAPDLAWIRCSVYRSCHRVVYHGIQTTVLISHHVLKGDQDSYLVGTKPEVLVLRLIMRIFPCPWDIKVRQEGYLILGAVDLSHLYLPSSLKALLALTLHHRRLLNPGFQPCRQGPQLQAEDFLLHQ